MKPTIGRIVHYKPKDDMIWPAIITEVPGENGTVSGSVDGAIILTVFSTIGISSGVLSLSMAAGPREAKEGQWWWPERV